MLMGERTAYVGSTAQRPRRLRDHHLDRPAPRFDQHLRSLLRRDVKPNLHKAGCFAHEHPGAVAVRVIASGSEPLARALERRIIRTVAPEANTTFSARGPWRRPPQSEPVRDHAPRRRPPPRFRMQANPMTVMARASSRPCRNTSSGQEHERSRRRRDRFASCPTRMHTTRSRATYQSRSTGL